MTTVAILIGYGYSSGFQGETSEKLKWLGFIVIAITIQIAVIYWIKDTLIDVSATKGGARFATRWGMISQIFVTWHIASAWRRLIDEPSAFTMIIEELTLMVLTVLLAIWSLASRDVNRGGKLFTSENALFWGLAFGFGYAGSIAMITNLSDSLGGGNLATTMAIGHLVTALTLIIIHSKTLRNHKIRILNPPQVMVQKADNIEIQVTDVEPVEDEPEIKEPDTQEQVIDLDELEFSDDVVELMD
uniref:Uncharacterized protein n=1 Tax=uncultured marine group II/III euryarchaeote KM3_74_D01 TaxID=1456502 RepID=A0A075HKT3_9EURY|nr:hypothetical protein [uncultured marine group II/III euryarchaeote KM3_74_D01]